MHGINTFCFDYLDVVRCWFVVDVVRSLQNVSSVNVLFFILFWSNFLFFFFGVFLLRLYLTYLIELLYSVSSCWSIMFFRLCQLVIVITSADKVLARGLCLKVVHDFGPYVLLITVFATGGHDLYEIMLGRLR